MSFNVFAYLLLALIPLIATYVISVSSVEPPLEYYEEDEEVNS